MPFTLASPFRRAWRGKRSAVPRHPQQRRAPLPRIATVIALAQGRPQRSKKIAALTGNDAAGTAEGDLLLGGGRWLLAGPTRLPPRTLGPRQPALHRLPHGSPPKQHGLCL